jgi:YD repeat-containing protein
MSYDTNGHLIASKDALGDLSGFSYDRFGAVASETDALRRTSQLLSFSA